MLEEQSAIIVDSSITESRELFVDASLKPSNVAGWDVTISIVSPGRFETGAWDTTLLPLRPHLQLQLGLFELCCSASPPCAAA